MSALLVLCHSYSVSLKQAVGGEDLCPVHGPSQSRHRGEDEVSVLPVCLLGHKRSQVSKDGYSHLNTPIY